MICNKFDILAYTIMMTYIRLICFKWAHWNDFVGAIDYLAVILPLTQESNAMFKTKIIIKWKKKFCKKYNIWKIAIRI